MSALLSSRAMLAAILLCLAPAISGAQAPQAKPCKDGTTTSRSYFACWGHGGVDTTRASDGPRAAASKHRAMEPIQAGTPRSKSARNTTRAESKKVSHHARVEDHDRRTREKQQDKHRRKSAVDRDEAKRKDVKKSKERANAARLPLPERPNGQPRASAHRYP